MKDFLIIIGLLIFCWSCSKLELILPLGLSTDIEADSIRFVVIGDYGDDGTPEKNVAELVASLDPDFIITTGDNNYRHGKLSTICDNITKHYGDYIYNFDTAPFLRCNGRAFDEQQNRFFPSPGNHDYDNRDGITPYLNFFTLPGRETYYDFKWGPIHFFSLNSIEKLSEQRIWLDEQFAQSDKTFKIAYFHHSPYSSGVHGNEENMQWDFSGIDFVMSGHDHIYSRIEKLDEEGPVYIITGLGGRSKRECGEYPLDPSEFSEFCYDAEYGALLVTANPDTIKLRFININGEVIDEF